MWTLREWVQEAMRVVTSADDAYRWIRGQGVEVTRAAVREMWRDVGMKDYWSTVLGTYGSEQTPPRAWTVAGPQGMRTPYQQLVEYEYIDPEGRLQTRYIAYTTDKPLPYREIYARITETIKEYVELERGILTFIGPGGIKRRP